MANSGPFLACPGFKRVAVAIILFIYEIEGEGGVRIPVPIPIPKPHTGPPSILKIDILAKAIYCLEGWVLMAFESKHPNQKRIIRL